VLFRLPSSHARFYIILINTASLIKTTHLRLSL
jgi:hypothetical protein